MPNTLNILLLSEGTAETPHGSFSGSAHSVVCELRTQGHHVATWDVELRRTDKLIAAARAFSPNRERWGARFRLGGAAFSARSKKAARAPRESSQVLVQIGATFEPRCNSIPYTLYCDSNIAMSLGVPAVTLDGGGRGLGSHALAESYEDGPRGWDGPQWALLLAVSLAGVR